MAESAAADEFASMKLQKGSMSHRDELEEEEDARSNDDRYSDNQNSADQEQDMYYSSNINRKFSNVSAATTNLGRQAPPIMPAETMPKVNSSGSAFGAANTGPKGVLADARSYEEARRREMQTKQQQHQQDGFYNPPSFLSSQPTTFILEDDRMRSSMDVNDDDDDIMQMWRKKRLQELKMGASLQQKKAPTKRRYGRQEEVDAMGYLDAVDKATTDAVVVVTIFDDKSSESRFVEDCMGTLARRHIYTRFIKIHYSEAEMDPQVMPAVLAYKGGELIANMPRVVDEVPAGRELSSESLEVVLKKCNVLTSNKSTSRTSLYNWDDD